MDIDFQLARIVDANANRVREGLRTAEDFVRFLIGDLQQAGRIKLLRQTLTEILRSIAGLEAALLKSRNVSADPMRPENWKDVLRRIEHETPREVALRGMKRAQEGLRVIEENLRGAHLTEAEHVGRLRYLAYESEQWLYCASKASQILQSATVYVLLTTELCNGRDPRQVAKAVLKGGVKVIQLREKGRKDANLLALARDVRVLCAEHEAVFICNDRVDIALYSGADGAHLGQGEASLGEARQICGQRLILGRSTHNVQEAQAAATSECADYIGVGAMYPTDSKAELSLGGPKLLQDVMQLKLKLPIFAIGGITLERIKALRDAGGTRVAVSSAIISAIDPEREAARFIAALGS